MKRGLLLLLAIFPLLAPGKAYFAPKAEMIKRADAIVVATVTDVSTVEKKSDGWTYSQKAVANVERTLKGDARGTIEIYGGESFICAQCNFAKGRHLLFLGKVNGFWTGVNWQPGIRPITGDQVTWFAKEDDAFETKSAPLADVIAEIEAQVKPAAERDLPFRHFGADDYQSFVQNWDEVKQPVFCAFIRSPAEWTSVFHPAPVMRNKKPFEPAASLYTNEQILVVARVMAAPEDGAWDKIFRVQKLTVGGDTLTLRYTYTPPQKGASYTIKNPLGVIVPKQNVAHVQFIENDQPVGRLDLQPERTGAP